MLCFDVLLTHALLYPALLCCPDILTPLPALGVDFTIIPGKGPKILNPIKTKEDVAALKPMHDVAQQVPFLGPILQVNQFSCHQYFFAFWFHSVIFDHPILALLTDPQEGN